MTVWIREVVGDRCGQEESWIIYVAVEGLRSDQLRDNPKRGIISIIYNTTISITCYYKKCCLYYDVKTSSNHRS